MTACVLCRAPADGEPARYQIPVAGVYVKIEHALCKGCAAAAEDYASAVSGALLRRAMRQAHALAGGAVGGNA